MSVIHPGCASGSAGPEGTQALVELINRAGNEIRGHVLQQADERFARRLAETIAALETRLTERMAALETRVIRWTFVFWVGQLAPILAVLFVFFEP